MQYLSDIYDSIILKDIASRNRIRDIELLKRVIQFFMANIRNGFSAANISRYYRYNIPILLLSEVNYDIIHGFFFGEGVSKMHTSTLEIVKRLFGGCALYRLIVDTPN